MGDDKQPQAAEHEPVQLFRFVVRTADGREMTSAVAVVDPNSKDANKADPKDTMDALDQQHKEEDAAHGDDLTKAHQDEAKKHAETIDAHHEDVKAVHDEAQAAKTESAVTKAEAATKLKHADELGSNKKTLEEKHQGEKESLFGGLFDKAKTAMSGLVGKLNTTHLGDLAKQGETQAKGFFDKLVKQGEDFAKGHVEEL